MEPVERDRRDKLKQLQSFLNYIDERVLSISQELNWDYEKLIQEDSSAMVTCSVNPQHKVPAKSVKTHEEKCHWHQEGYHDDDKPFSEFFGSGSTVSLNPSLLKSITQEALGAEKPDRSVPQTSANLDQNFSREEKLAIYDYVISNTQKQKSFSNLNLELPEKNEKKEMTEWEIAAAERDAKRRRASYRNKVHTNRKTHTEILKEVIEVQMEALKEESISNTQTPESDDDFRRSSKKHKHKKDKYSDRDSPDRRDRKGRHDKRDRDRHSKHKDRSRQRSPPDSGSYSDSRSRSHDKYRKYESRFGRSHSHKSSKYSDKRQG